MNDLLRLLHLDYSPSSGCVRLLLRYPQEFSTGLLL